MLLHISRQKEMLLYMDIDYLLYIGQLTKGSNVVNLF